MAIALVQTSSTGANTGANTVSPTLGSPLTVGNLAIACIEWGAVSGDAGVTVTSVTDTGSNTWHQASGAFVSSAGFFRHCDIWYTNVTSPTSNVTIHFSANQSFGGTCITEWSGARTSSPLDFASNVDQEGSSAPVSPSMTPSVTGELLISVCNSNVTGESGVNSPWLSTAGGTDANAYFINPPISVQQAQFTPTTSQPFVSSGAAFLPPATGASAKKKASTNLVF